VPWGAGCLHDPEDQLSVRIGKETELSEGDEAVFYILDIGFHYPFGIVRQPHLVKNGRSDFSG
jgi:hypothetical protein